MTILDRRNTMYALVLTAALAAASPIPAFAEEPHTFDIRTADNARAIQAFGTQSGIQILASAEQLQGKKLHDVTGAHTTDAAFKILLADTGLTHKYVGDRTVALIKDDGSHSSSGREPVGESAGKKEPSKSFWSRLRIARADATETPSSSKRESQDLGKNPEIESIDEVIVTGSHIRGEAPAGSKVITITREEIDRSGYAGMQDLLENLPQNFSGTGSEDFTQINDTRNNNRASTVDLRGLGAGTTLILVNGRRQPNGDFFGSFVDISSIASSAVERVEILADGASALYGSDAMGGVVNFILRKDYQGMETRLRLGSADGYADDVQLSQLFGTNWSSGNLLAGYQYYRRDELPFSAVPYLRTSGDMRQFGGTDFRSVFGSPGNILDPATSRPAYAIPPGQDGTQLTVADLIPILPDGTNTNYQDGVTNVWQLPQQEANSAFFTATQSINDRWQVFAEGRFAAREINSLDGGNIRTSRVPSSNPFYVNPFPGTSSVSVSYNFEDILGPLTAHGSTDTYAGTLGTSISLSQKWQLTFASTYGKERSRFRSRNLTSGALINAALALTDRATALNLFGDGSANNPATLAALQLNAPGRAKATTWDSNLIVDGPLFDLPSGAVKVAMGLNHREEQQLSGITASIAESFHREVSAAFAEFAVPLVRDKLELSLAARYEDYSDFGHTLDPKAGLAWKPVDFLALRGTWGTSFKAPRFIYLSPTFHESAVGETLLDDPQSTNGTGLSNVLFPVGPVPDLHEETATVWTAGLDITLPASPGTQLSLTYFNIAYKDKIASPDITVVLFQEEAWAGIINRTPSPELIDSLCAQIEGGCSGAPVDLVIDSRLRNLAVVDVRGLDLEVNHSWENSLGRFGVSVGGTRMFHYEQAVTDSAPKIELVNTMGNPLKTRLRGHVSWDRGSFGAGASLNYTGSYSNPGGIPAQIDSFETVDLNFHYQIENRAGWLNDITLNLSATNVFDKMPPFVNSLSGYDAANGNVIGRVVSLQLTKEW